MALMDEVMIRITSGRGGNGCESYIRRPDRKMIPDGGDGGSGGDIVLCADAQTGSLSPLHTKRIFEAEAGGFGKGKNRYGQNGKSFVIKVPCGTLVHDCASGLLLRDLARAGDQVIALKGGRGGYGNHQGRPATLGEEGKMAELRLTLNIPADVFFVGLPNSGKTTLLKALTGAHVEPANYPFATKTPCLGTLQAEEEKLRLCELPSLYAHSLEGRGLGTDFLKHLRRAALILLVLDPLNPFARHLKDGYDILIRTIREFDAALLDIPRVVVINKMDLQEAKKILAKKKPRFSEPVFQISAVSGLGFSKLIRAMLKTVRARREGDGLS